MRHVGDELHLVSSEPPGAIGRHEQPAHRSREDSQNSEADREIPPPDRRYRCFERSGAILYQHLPSPGFVVALHRTVLSTDRTSKNADDHIGPCCGPILAASADTDARAFEQVAEFIEAKAEQRRGRIGRRCVRVECRIGPVNDR